MTQSERLTIKNIKWSSIDHCWSAGCCKTAGSLPHAPFAARPSRIQATPWGLSLQWFLHSRLWSVRCESGIHCPKRHCARRSQHLGLRSGWVGSSQAGCPGLGGPTAGLPCLFLGWWTFRDATDAQHSPPSVPELEMGTGGPRSDFVRIRALPPIY